MNHIYKECIGVFDSGVGGISVLKELYKVLPNENFLYYGDSANTPYGDKTRQQIRARSMQVVEHLMAQGAKAIVIACNTATSAAARALRATYPDIPVLGIEPALKPAAMKYYGKRLLVLATAATLKLEKFQQLKSSMEERDEIITLPCSGLAERIEQGNLDAPDLTELLQRLVGEYRGKVDSVVLGCTHYPFVRRQIRSVLGDVPFFDGAEGTARRQQSLLTEADLLKPEDEPGSVTFETSLSKPGELDLYQWFFDQEC